MNLEALLKTSTLEAIKDLYGVYFEEDKIIINTTPKEFEGNYTVVIFPIVKLAKKAPEAVGNEIGNRLLALEEVKDFNVVKGFLNLEISDEYWLLFLAENHHVADYGRQPATRKKIVVEYCGPNTNKPLHLWHIRNMLLGYSVATLLDFNGHEVHKVNIYNDRGIAICKSMVAWLRSGKQETPESSGKKGDHLVGLYYVEYDMAYKAEVEELIREGMPTVEAKKNAPILKEAQEMLRKWEAGDQETLELWKKMNGWVYEGFQKTYDSLGVDFEKAYYESKTYLFGKTLVEEGLKKGVFDKKDDGSVWVNLTDEGLDEKILLRSDGTSVYLTQDLGTAQQRYDDYQMDRSIYVVANEQDYHFQVLKLTLQKLEKPYADGIHHLSYGMVDLPSGKMKSREGTVVDADDLVAEMQKTAEEKTKELGKIDDFSDAEAQDLYHKIGLGALKFFILKVDPKKRMLFNPSESIDFHGQTGPFVQYTYARIQSMLRKAGSVPELKTGYAPSVTERELLLLTHEYPSVVREAGANLSPALVANFAYQLAKTYNKFYAEYPVLNAENEKAKNFRLVLSAFVGSVIQSAFKLLGIEVPDRM